MVQIIETTKRRRRAGNKYIWMLIAVTAVTALLYWEQIAVLYVISTLALTGLLLVVAFSDLKDKDIESPKSAETKAAVISENNVTDAASSPALPIRSRSENVKRQRDR